MGGRHETEKGFGRNEGEGFHLDVERSWVGLVIGPRLGDRVPKVGSSGSVVREPILVLGLFLVVNDVLDLPCFAVVADFAEESSRGTGATRTMLPI